jgi:hypothetical protein
MAKLSARGHREIARWRKGDRVVVLTTPRHREGPARVLVGVRVGGRWTYRDYSAAWGQAVGTRDARVLELECERRLGERGYARV